MEYVTFCLFFVVSLHLLSYWTLFAIDLILLLYLTHYILLFLMHTMVILSLFTKLYLISFSTTAIKNYDIPSHISQTIHTKWQVINSHFY